MLVVYLDLDGDGTRDIREPQATASAVFARVPTAPPVAAPPPVVTDTTRPNGTLPRRIQTTGRELMRKGKLVDTVVVNEPATVRQGLYLDDGTAPRAVPARKRSTLLGSGSTTSPRDGKVKVTVELNRKGREAFRRRKVRVVLLTTLVDLAGNRRALPAKRFVVKR